MGVLELKNVSLTLGGKPILNDLTVDFWEGHIHALVGLNGAGRWTLAWTARTLAPSCRPKSPSRMRRSPRSTTCRPPTRPAPAGTWTARRSCGARPSPSRADCSGQPPPGAHHGRGRDRQRRLEAAADADGARPGRGQGDRPHHRGAAGLTRAAAAGRFGLTGRPHKPRALLREVDRHGKHDDGDPESAEDRRVARA